MKFERVEIIKTMNATNNGVSGRRDKMILIWSDEEVENPIKIEEFIKAKNFDPDEVLVLIKRTLWEEEHWYARPFISKIGLGPMNGGNSIEVDSQDLKVSLKIHDRWETQNEYNFYSA